MHVLDPGPLLERRREIGRIDDALSHAIAGRGCALAVEGPPGIGKTRLLQTVADRCRTDGLPMLTARATSLERAFAFGVVRQLLERHLAKLPPAYRADALSGSAALAERTLTEAPRPEAPRPGADFAAVHGLYWLTANLAADRPLVLVVDDAHWIDGASLGWLQYLVPRLDGLSVLLVLGYRPSDPGTQSGALRALVGEHGVDVVAPGALSLSAVHTLVEARIGRTENGTAQACHAVSGGNPFLLQELLRTLATGAGSPSEETVRRAAPESVARRIGGRIDRLDLVHPGVRALAEAASVLGPGARLDIAASLASLTLEQAANLADALVAAEIFASAAPIEFLHPLVWSSVYDAIPPGQRAVMHADAAGALDGEPRQAAAHLLRAPPRGDDRVVETLSSVAADAIARGAVDDAVAYLRRALAEGPSGHVRGRLLRELGTAELLVNDPSADGHLRDAIGLERDPRGRVASARLLANLIALRGDIGGALQVIDLALGLVEPGDRDLRLTLEAERMTACIDPEFGADLVPRLERVLGEPRRGEETDAERLVLAALATAGLCRGAPTATEVIDHAERAMGEDALLTVVDSESAIWIACVTCLWACDRIARATALFGLGIARATERGSMFGYAHACAFRAMSAWRAGDLAAAETDARAALGVPGALPPEVSFVALAPLIATLADRGRFDDADSLLAEHALADEVSGGHHTVWLLEARGRLRLARRDARGALADFTDGAERHRQLGIANPAIVPWGSCLALALVAGGDPAAAATAAERELVVARRIGAPRPVGLALHALGLARGDEAVLQEAVAVLRTSESVLDLARTLHDLGALRRRAGRRREARGPLAEALDIATRCGAHPLAAAAEDELRATGAQPRRTARSGVDALTPSEERIARLAMDGRTNREIAQALFVTVKTVEMHLSSAYRKLAISSRSELPTVLEH